MDQRTQNNPGDVPQHSAEFGHLPNDSEGFGTVPKSSEAFRTVPQRSEVFRNIPKAEERKENHTLTVREAARLFEAAGVARTERSIINWCQVNKMGVARLDYYFDPNERKYFISLQSVEAAIQEEKAKALKGIGPASAEGSFPKDSETLRNVDKNASHDEPERVRELEKELLDLKITNRGKDYFIEQLQKERESFGKEREEYVEKLMGFNRKLGELETKLLQLEGPRSSQGHDGDTGSQAV